jgi:glycosyltransferase involved in cell wall biosynthesis
LNSSKPLISVIIPVFNRDALITQTLKSVMKQSYRPIEVIIVNDGSTDNTEDVVCQWKSENENSILKIKYVKQNNKGACAARNTGLKMAEGNYIQFLDSDDFLKEDKILKQMEILKNEKADIVVCDYERHYSDGSIKTYSNFNPYNIVRDGGSVWISTPLIEAGLAKRISWDEKLNQNQDSDYITRVFLLARKVIHNEGSLCIYQFHEGPRIRDIYHLRRTYFKRAINIMKLLINNIGSLGFRKSADGLILTYILLIKEFRRQLKRYYKKLRIVRIV